MHCCRNLSFGLCGDGLSVYYGAPGESQKGTVFIHSQWDFPQISPSLISHVFLRASQSLVLGVGAWTDLWVCFDPLHRRDQATRVAEDVLEIRYQGHPQRDLVALKGEVHFPNLHFSSSTLDFGCVLNHTEAQQQITMTNCSPLPVSYRWTFLLDHKHHCIRYQRGGQADIIIGIVS